MTPPHIDLAAVAPHELLRLLQQHGSALIDDPLVPVAVRERALRDAQAFFALPTSDKAALAIERSPHYRGYSQMHNERDWREQVHFGCERAAGDAAAVYAPLQGPNLWPSDPAWRARMLAYLEATAGVGRRLLGKLAAALSADAEAWLGADPYLLMKCIAYHPQPRGEAPRQGVASHLDFSLVTLTLQDDVGGLEVRDPSGAWRAVPTDRPRWLLNLGELLQYVSGNRLVATPHRVVNPSQQRTRVSIPVFVNPSLDVTLARHRDPLPLPAVNPAEHVHAVLPGGSLDVAIPFGVAEWQRKGENRWCAVCQAAKAGRDIRSS